MAKVFSSGICNEKGLGASRIGGDVRRVTTLAALSLVATSIALCATSASATVLCKEAPDVPNSDCAAGPGDYAKDTVIKAAAAKSVFTVTPKKGSTAENIVCKTSMELKLTSTGGGIGTNVTGNIEKMEFPSCTMEKSNLKCTAKVVGTPPATFTLAWTKEGNGDLSASKITIEATCPFILACVYTVSPTLPMIGSGTTPEIVASEVALTQSEPTGFMDCPTSTKFDATYAVESPTPLWVTRKMA